ncbi:hypothetical protein ABID30_000742 [Enterococcus rotai]|uniref:Aminoacyl-transfer RNA synthetases class-II family profile domain-containing protein n=1 Tax=Enterococcus rotai TaxID=118060 RepID=A0A0U2VNK8_9ENTE|nr:hypothetical protein [Enterococcus rotai]ALS36063.1 hypothetical protein ATZ35_02470 [Enterococcus rotai]
MNDFYQEILIQWHNLVKKLEKDFSMIHNNYSKVIQANIFDSTGYNDLFIDNLIYIDNSKTTCISPTVCHHVYSELQDTQCHNNIFSVENLCGRKQDNHGVTDHHYPLFTMHEFIIIGTKDYVDEMTLLLENKIIEIFSMIFGELEIVQANDSFFSNPQKALLKKIQTNQNVKKEIRVNQVSLSSINKLGKKYGRALNIKSVLNNEYVSSSCIGFGLDRFVRVLEQFNKDDVVKKIEGVINGYE